MEPKYIDYEITGENLFFIRDDGHKVQVEKGSAEAEQLFEEVAKNRDLAGLNGEEAKAAREKKEQQKEEDPKVEDGVGGASGEDTPNTSSEASSSVSSDGNGDGAGASQPDGGSEPAVPGPSTDVVPSEPMTGEANALPTVPVSSENPAQVLPNVLSTGENAAVTNSSSSSEGDVNGVAAPQA